MNAIFPNTHTNHFINSYNCLNIVNQKKYKRTMNIFAKEFVVEIIQLLILEH